MKQTNKIVLLTLVCCLFTFCWNTTKAATTYYGKATAESKPSIGGVVYVSNPQKDALGWFWRSVEDTQTIQKKVPNEGKDVYTIIIPRYVDGLGKDVDVEFHFVALPNKGYKFDKWTTDFVQFKNASEANNNPASNKVTIKSKKENDPTGMGTYYANFVASKVDNVVSKTDVAVSGNPYGVSNEGTVVFTVSNANGVEDFTCSISGEGFAFADGTYENSATYNNDNGQITIRYTYTADNALGIFNGTITLTSKGHDDGQKESEKSETIVATVSDFTPSFSVSDYNYNFDNQVVVGGNFYNGANKLAPTSLNVFANAQPATENKNGTVWSVWLSDDASGVFSVDGALGADGKYHPDKGNATVKLSPKKAGAYSAKLHIQCTYYDKNGQPTSTEKIITLLANTISVGSKLLFNAQDGYAHTFSDTYCAEKIENTIPLQVEHVTDLSCSIDGNTDNVFTCSLVNNQVVISILSQKPGNYSAVVVVKGKNSNPGHENEETSATMQVSGKVLLHTPELKALSGHSQVTLRWQPIVGATGYVLKQGTTVLANLSADKTEYVHSNLPVKQTYTYTLTAVYAPDETCNTSATATATLGVITAESASATGLQTGTQHPTNNTFPYKKLRDIDLSAAFANGKAACDLLYIFGVTTNTDEVTVTVNGKEYPVINKPSSVAASNAKTPCYIYKRDGDNYRHEATIENMNVPSKPSQFKISANGQKLYFTGYCPIATTGSTPQEDGIIFVTGGENSKIDLYLSDLQVYPRPKRADGRSGVNADTAKVKTEGLTNIKMYVIGSGSSIVFRSTSESSKSPFRPSIHVCGDNTLEGAQGSFVKVEIASKVRYAGQYSAPLHIQSRDTKECTVLSIDDIWFSRTTSSSEHCNGILRLTKLNNNAPSIDIGNANTILNFNGGQIYLENAVPQSSQYETAFAMSYRSYSMTKAFIKATIYGIGGDQADGTICFNDGSIYCKPLDKANLKNYVSYYRDMTSMKCPRNTTINGGTFNCDIWACEMPSSLGASPTNYAGDSLRRISFKIENKHTYGLADPITFSSALTYKGETLTEYYRTHTPYGQNSIMPNDTNYVFYMLPSDHAIKDISIKSWVLCIPELSAGSSTLKMDFGGDKTILFDDSHKISKMCYGIIDYASINEALNGYRSPDLQAEIALDEKNVTHKQILNDADYAISDKIYMLLPIKADEWRVFVPPFDVSAVSVIESYPDDSAKVCSSVEEARRLQNQRTIDLLYYIAMGAELNNSQADMSGFVGEWTSYIRSKYKYVPKIEPLKHFTGSNFDAHYYLYHSSGTWSFDGVNFTTDWQPAAVENKQFDGMTHPVMMKQGEIYAFEFPYKQGNDHTEWDYWTGKYLLLEGYGPQTLHGTNYASEVTGDYLVSGSASLRGNATFADMTVQKSNAYYLTTSTSGNTENNKYIAGANQSRTLEPAEGFLLANIPASSAPARAIAINTGVVTYDQETETTAGVPTIAGGRTLIVNSVDGGLTMIPVVPQQVGIYGSAGQLIASDYMTDETTLSLPAGIYMVRGEKETAKVIVR